MHRSLNPSSFFVGVLLSKSVKTFLPTLYIQFPPIESIGGSTGYQSEPPESRELRRAIPSEAQVDSSRGLG